MAMLTYLTALLERQQEARRSAKMTARGWLITTAHCMTSVRLCGHEVTTAVTAWLFGDTMQCSDDLYGTQVGNNCRGILLQGSVNSS